MSSIGRCGARLSGSPASSGIALSRAPCLRTPAAGLAMAALPCGGSVARAFMVCSGLPPVHRDLLGGSGQALAGCLADAGRG